MTTDDDLLDMRTVRENMALWGSEASREMRALMEIFAADVRRTAVKMGASAAAAGSIAGEAHRLKGAAASLGAMRVAALCFELERCAREGREGEIPQRLAGLVEALDATCARMREVLAG